MEFSHRLRQTMEDKSITAYRLAKELGVHQTTIKNWLDGKGAPHLNQVKEIAKILDVDIVYLISGQTTEEVESGILIQAEAEAKAKFEKLQLESNDKSYEYRVSISSAFIRVFKLFGELNTTGIQKALERAEEIAEIPRYRRTDADPAPSSDAFEETPEDE